MREINKQKRKITLLDSKQAKKLEAQFTRVRAELLELQRQLELSGAVPVGGWRPGHVTPGDCDDVCDTECGIVCFQGCPNDCDDTGCEDAPCEDSERLWGPDFIEQILLPSVRVEGVLLSKAKTARSKIK